MLDLDATTVKMFKLQAWKPLMISAFLSVVVAQTPVDFNVTASTSLEVVLQPSNVTLTASRLVSQEGMEKLTVVLLDG